MEKNGLSVIGRKESERTLDHSKTSCPFAKTAEVSGHQVRLDKQGDLFIDRFNAHRAW